MAIANVPSSLEEVIAATDQALAMAPVEYPPTLPAKHELLGAPDWYPFEHEAWPVGEAIRHAFKAHPSLKRDSRAIEAVLHVIEHRHLRRGRQSFVMAISFVAARPFAPRVAAFLADPDIDGQVIRTLIGMKAAGYADAVRPHLSARHAWIRRYAKRY